MIKARHFTASLAGLTALLSACTMMPQADSALAGEAAFAEADGAFHSQAGDMGDFLIARYASLTNDPEAAAENYARIARIHPGDRSITERAVFSALLANDFPLALSISSQAGKSVLDETSLLRLTLAADAIASENFLAVSDLTARSQSGPFHTMVLGSLEAWAEFGLGNLAQAELKLMDAAGEDAYLRGIMLNSLALMEVAGGQDEEAIETLEVLSANGTLIASTADTYARLLAERGKRDAARDVLQTYLEQTGHNPRITDVLERLEAGEELGMKRLTAREGAALAIYVPAAALAAQSADDLPGVYYSIALHLDPDLQAARALFADALDRSGRSEEAIAMLEAIPASSPYHVSATGQLAWALYRAGRKDEALDLARRTLEGEPQRDLKIQMADLLSSLNQDEESLVVFDEIIRSDEASGIDDWRLYYARGTLHEALGRWPQAEEDLLKAKTLNPDSPEVLNHLGYSWVDRGLHLERGMDLIRQALSLRPNSGAITDSLGWGYYKLGDFERAVHYLELAAEIQPDLAEIIDHLGDAYWMTGRRLEARFQWERAITLLEDEQDIHRIERKMLTGPETQAASRTP